MNDATNAAPRTVTLGVLAGAYLNGRRGHGIMKTMLTHSAQDGREKTLCNRLDVAEKLVDEGGMSDEGLAAAPTCPGCARRDPRFKK